MMEYKIPINLAEPGMTISRVVTAGGKTVAPAGATLNKETIEALTESGVEAIFVRHQEVPLEDHKIFLVQGDGPPSYEAIADSVRAALWAIIPTWVHPHHSSRDSFTCDRVKEVVEATFDVLLASERLFNLLKTSSFFSDPVLRHCPITWIYSLSVAAERGMSSKEMLELSFASLFYDIGMLYIPKPIVRKPGPLTESEFEEVKKHTEIGRDLLARIFKNNPSIQRVAYEHHEEYAGGGYPLNLSHSQISEFSQIIHMTDKFAALITDRSHRRSFQPYQAFELLLSESRRNVSSSLFISFLKSVLIYPQGSLLRLSTGEVGEAIDFPVNMPSRPTVRIKYNSAGQEILQEKRIALIENPSITIEGFTTPT